MLYNSLDPRSIAQHLALYDLYPDSKEGKQAFQDACRLLTGGNSSLSEQLHFLPDLSTTIHGIVALVNKIPDAATIDLSDEELSLINRLGARLPNRALKGYNAPTEQAVLQLPPDQIDLARGVLLSQLGHTPDALRTIASYEATIDLMALQLLTRINLSDPPQAKIRAINNFIFGELGFRFPPHSSYAKDVDLYTFLPSVLDSRRGVCLGVSILYISLAQRLDLGLEMITPPGHIYVRWREGDNEINIETTARGIHLPSEEYLGVDTRSLQQRNVKEVIGMAHFNQASVFWERKQHEKALQAYTKAQQYLPNDPLLIQLMGYCKVVSGDLQGGRILLQQIAGTIADHAVSKETVPEDFLYGAVGPDGIEAIFAQVDETRDSLILKKQSLESATQKYPRFREGLFSLAGTWLQLHRTSEALATLRRYHELDPSNATVEYYLTVLYAERLDYNNAWKHLRQAEQLTEARQHSPQALIELRRALALRSPE